MLFRSLPQNNFIPNYLTVKKAIDLTIKKLYLKEFYECKIIMPIINSKIGDLSGGELKYLQIKLILFNEAKFCLLDEPYNGISPIMCEIINNLIVEQSKYKGIIITDHNYPYLLQIAKKIFLIKDGVGKFLKNKEELVKFGYLNEGMLK